jgi:uncharacterized CHY-type Zn-finger protein
LILVIAFEFGSPLGIGLGILVGLAGLVLIFIMPDPGERNQPRIPTELMGTHALGAARAREAEFNRQVCPNCSNQMHYNEVTKAFDCHHCSANNCPDCGSALVFNEVLQKKNCPYCHTAFD